MLLRPWLENLRKGLVRYAYRRVSVSRRRQDVSRREYRIRYAEILEPRILLASVVWTGDGDGVHWGDAANWSGSALPGAADDVTINSGSNGVLHDSGNDAVHSLTTSSTFSLTGGVLTVGSTVQVNNTFTLAGGTLSGGVITCAAGQQLVIDANNTSGTFTGGVTLNGDLTVSGSNAALRISGGLTLNGTIHMTGSNTYVRSFGDETFGGTGTISFEGTTGSLRQLTIEGASTLTLAPTFSVVGGYATIGNQVEQGGTNTLVNQGLISANVSGQGITIAPNGTFKNAGTMEAVGGGTLSLANSWSNSGTLRLDSNAASTVNLGGTFTTAGIGTINRSGGVVNLTGTLTNANSTLTLNAATGSWNFFGTVSGGTVAFADGAALLLSTNNTSGTFTGGVTLNSDLFVSGSNTALRISGGLTLNGTIHMTGSNTYVRSFGNETFGGTGTISFEGTTGSVRQLTIEGASTLTLAPTFSVVGGYATIGNQVEQGGTNALVNQGLISANVSGQTLTIAPNGPFTNTGTTQAISGATLTINNLATGSTGTVSATDSTLTLQGGWTNTGTISVTNSTLNLGGTFTTAGIGTINRSGGVVNLAGTLTNTNSTLTLNAATGSWNFFGTVSGGTVAFADGAALLLSTNNTSGTFTGGVTLNSDLFVSGSNTALRISGGLTLNGTIHMTGSNTYVRSFGNETFGGTGTISFEGTTGSLRQLTIEGASTLTLAPTFSVVGGYATIGNQVEQGGTNALVNQGLISANVSGQTLTIAPNGTFTNAGTMEAVGGGILSLANSWSNSGTLHLDSNAASTVNLGGTFTNPALGTINRAGGVVNLAGTLTNTGSTLTLNATTGSWNFFGTVSGGTVAFADGAALLLSTNNTSGTFTGGVTLNSDLFVSGSNTALRISGGLTLNGTIHMAGSNTYVRSFGNETFGGTGTISFEGTTGSLRQLTIEGASTLTLAPTFSVVGGYATIGNQVEQGGTNTLVNQGLISANVSGQTLTIAPNGTFTNAGTMEAVGGGILSLANSWSNSGTLHLDSNAASTVNLGGTFTTAGIGTINRSGGVVNLTGTLTNTNSTLTLNAATRSWNFFGTVSGGTVAFADGAALLLSTNNTSGTFTGGVTLNSDLFVSGSNTALRVSGGLTLNGTIHMTGSNTYVRSFGNETFGGTGTISFEGTTGSLRQLTIEGASTLTLAPTFSVVGGYATIGNQVEQGGTNALVNQGLISANVSGQTLTIAPNGTFTNAGTMEAVGGGILSLANSWSNSGTLHLDSNAASTVNLGGTFTNPALGTINRAGGVVNLAGTLTNTGSTLTLNATTGSWNFFGTVSGGTVAFADGAALLLSTNNTSGTFTGGVTLNSDLFVSGSNTALRISGGLTLNGTIHMAGSNTYVRSFGNETFGGTGTISFEGTTGSLRQLTIEGASTLTLAPTFSVVGGYATIGNQVEQGGTNTLVNQGLISANVSGQTLTIAPNGTFTNTGMLQATHGTTLAVSNGPGLLRIDGSGNLFASPTSTIVLNGNLLGSTQNNSLFDPHGTVLLNGVGNSSAPKLFEVMSQDLGAGASGFVSNFAYGTLSLRSGTYYQLQDLDRNSAGSGAEAVYVDSLIVPAGTTLDLNGFKVYVHSSQVAGQIVGGSLQVATAAPTVDLNGPDAAGTGFNATFLAGGPAVSIVDPSVTVTDGGSPTLDSATATIADRPDGSAEVLAVNTAGTEIQAVFANGVLSLTGTDSVAHYQQVLATVTYTDNAAAPSISDRSVSISVNDGTSASAPVFAKVHIGAEPVLDLNGPAQPGTGFIATFLAAGSAVSIVDPALTVSDAESATLVGITATMANRPDGAAEVLSVNTQGTSIQASYANGVLVLSGTDTLAHYQQVLAGATYNNTASAPTSVDRSISIVANDGTRSSAPAIVTVHVGALPTVDLSGPGQPGNDFSTTFLAGGPKVPLADPSLTVTDFESSILVSTTVTLTNRPDGTAEVLAVNTTGTSVQAGYANGVLTLSGTDTLAHYQQVLATATYNNTAAIPDFADRLLSIVLNDGIRQSVPASVTMHIDALPAVDLNGPNQTGTGFVATLPAGSSPVSIVDPAVTITDLKNATLVGMTISLANTPDGSAEVLAVDTSGTSIQSGYANGTLTLSGADTLAHYRQVLASATYNDAAPVPTQHDATISVVANDGNHTSTPVFSTVHVGTIPIIDLNGPNQPGTGFTATFQAGGPVVSIVDPTVTITDLGRSTLVGATITLANRPDGSAEVLAVNTSGTAVVASYAGGVLTLSGVDSLAHYQQVLATATYTNSALQPTAADRSLTATINDGILTSAAAPITVHVVVPPVDLVVTTVTAPLTAVGGTPVTVSWTVKNQGTAAAPNAWSDAVYLSSTPTPGSGAILLKTISESARQGLAANGVYTESQQVTLTGNLNGPVYLIVVTNVTATEPETDVSNNSQSTAMTLQRPDLVVAGVTAPSTGTILQAVTVSWTDQNIGAAPAIGPWTDSLYFSTSPSGTNPQFLKSLLFTDTVSAGSETPRSAQVDLPSIPGSYYLVVQTNVGGTVAEGPLISNNTTVAATPLIAQQDARPDLIIQNVSTSPGALQSGDSLTVKWQVANTGTAPASTPWYERVLVKNQAGDVLANATVLSDGGGNAPLAAGSTRDESYTFTLPEGSSGAGLLSITVTRRYIRPDIRIRRAGSCRRRGQQCRFSDRNGDAASLSRPGRLGGDCPEPDDRGSGSGDGGLDSHQSRNGAGKRRHLD
jgi:hypothetical protein